MSRPARRWGARLLLVAFGLLVSFGVLEVVFRLLPAERTFQDAVAELAAAAMHADAELGHRPLPLGQVDVDGVRYRFSSLGTRGPEPTLDRRPRVLVLGDSVAMGWGVAEAETLAAHLESDLAAAGVPAEVINAGVIGYGTEQELRWLEALRPHLQPDVVLLAYFPNDPEPPGGDPTLTGDPSWSAAWRFLAPRVDGLLVRLGLADSATDHHRALHAPGSAGWTRVSDGLKQLAERCRQHGIACGLLLLPELTAQPYPLADVHQRLAARAQEVGLAALDLAPAVAAEPPSSLWVAADDAHPNARGHALLAAAVGPWLISEGLLPPPAADR